jgi:hypothetical protein
MEDFFDNFDDDFDEGEFMDDDSFEENFEEEMEMDDTLEGVTELDDEQDNVESEEDKFTAKDAFLLGGAMGFAYEEGLEEGKRRKLEKEMNDKTDKKEDD